MGRWNLLAYFILLFGASATWPLLIPPFLLIGAMFVLPSNLKPGVLIKRLISYKNLPLLAAVLIQFIPVYFQYKYATLSTSADLNYTGGLTEFYPIEILFGLLLIIGLVLFAKIEESFKRLIISIFIPLFMFLAVLAFYQYFTIGEIHYYVIKISWLLEILLFAVGTAYLVKTFVSSKLYEARYAWFLPVVPLVIILLLISSVDNPLKDLRDLFRHYSNDVIPQYLDQDSNTEVTLGVEGKIKGSNVTALHFNPDQGKYFADMQIPYWADMVNYSGDPQDFKASTCIGNIYYNLAYGKYDVAAQQLLVSQINSCAINARKRGLKFYVVTDPMSEVHVKNLLGNLVTIVID
jgi:hypothetical protein